MAGEGFLNRWSRLKRDSLAPIADPATDQAPAPVQAPVQAPIEAPIEARVQARVQAPLHASDAAPGAGAAHPAAPHPAAPHPASPPAPAGSTRNRDEELAQGQGLPSLDELGLDSDYSPFMRAEVDPAKRVSALKKLFSDPHFNRMDGLDVYIDDYTKPDPVPKAMLARLNQSRLLGLFQEDEKTAREAAPAHEADGETAAREEVAAPTAAAPAGDRAAGDDAAGVEGMAEASGRHAAETAAGTGSPAAPASSSPSASPLAGPSHSFPDSPPDSPPDSSPDHRQAT